MTSNLQPPHARTHLWRALAGIILAAVTLLDVGISAQGQAQPSLDLAQAVSSATPGEPVVLRYNNRPITVLRAVIFSRTPSERAAGAVAVLDTLVRSGTAGAVTTRPLYGATMISAGGRDVFAILPLDVDPLAGETQEGKGSEAASRLQQALDEAIELRTPRLMFVSISTAAGATLLAVALLWVIRRLYRRVAQGLPTNAERKLQRLSAVDEESVRAARVAELLRRVIATLFAGIAIALAYSWLTFVLRRFPYTRPWGESLRGFLVEQLTAVGLMMVAAIPGLFTVLLIVLIVRFAIRVLNAVFKGVEEGRMTLPYVYPETAQPTRRLVNVVLWLLGLVLAYPYLPGSNSDAFKGVSVFVGLVLSLGSSGIVNQMMSGLTLTYSRAVRVGDFVRIGDVEGTVTHLGALSTKVKTPRGEEITIPNAVVMSQVTTNYSRLAESEGVYVPTSLTIGYDVPWRQIHALLLLAAERTSGVRKNLKPVVRQTALQDFYVQYTLLVSLEQPHMRGLILNELHANIQDAFNEFGVQIMSPNYEADPQERKVVPPEQWYAAPARHPAAREPA